MRNLVGIALVFGLSASTFACGGVQHDSPDQVVFDAPMLLACGDGTPKDVVATGDFNGDHLTDVVGCASSSSVSVFLNQGGGSFGDPKVVEADEIEGLEVHDVDGDGRSNLVLTTSDGNYGSTTTIAFATANGDFNVTQQPDYPRGCQNYVASFDGYADAVCYEDGNAVIYDIANDGTEQHVASIPVAGNPHIADLDGDGKPDFAYGIGSTVAVQLGHGTSFQAAQVVAVADEQVVEISFADIDGDGYVDMIVEVGSAGAYSYVLVHNDQGTGFTAMSAFAAVHGVDYTFEDVTGDGVMDTVLTENEQLMVMVGKGNGTFEDKALLVTGPWTNASGFSFADLNADGKPDLVVGGETVSVLLRQ